MLKVREHLNGQEAARDHRSTEVVTKPSRRRFTQAYIDAVHKELDEAKHGQTGKILLSLSLELSIILDSMSFGDLSSTGCMSQAYLWMLRDV